MADLFLIEGGMVGDGEHLEGIDNFKYDPRQGNFTPDQEKKMALQHARQDAVRIRNEYQRALLVTATRIYSQVVTENGEHVEHVMVTAKKMLDRSIELSREAVPLPVTLEK